MPDSPTPTPEHAPTAAEIAFVRLLQHFYCDCVVDGCPTGDWHIEATPEQAVRKLRARTSLAVAEATRELRARLESEKHQSRVNAMSADNWCAEAGYLRTQLAEAQAVLKINPHVYGKMKIAELENQLAQSQAAEKRLRDALVSIRKMSGSGPYGETAEGCVVRVALAPPAPEVVVGGDLERAIRASVVAPPAGACNNQRGKTWGDEHAADLAFRTVAPSAGGGGEKIGLGCDATHGYAPAAPPPDHPYPASQAAAGATPRTDELMHLLLGIELTMPSLLAHARTLERELTAAEVVKHCALREQQELHAQELGDLYTENAALRIERDALREDKADLDWCDHRTVFFQLFHNHGGKPFVNIVGESLHATHIRAAIRAARKTQEAKP